MSYYNHWLLWFIYLNRNGKNNVDFFTANKYSYLRLGIWTAKDLAEYRLSIWICSLRVAH